MPDFKSTEVDSREIENAAGSIDDCINELSSILAVFQNEVMTALSPYWEGEAKRSFERQFGEFSELYAGLERDYRDLNEQLKKAGKAYDNADESARQLIAKLP